MYTMPIFVVVGLGGSPNVGSPMAVPPKHYMYAIYIPTLTPKTTPTDRQSYGSPMECLGTSRSWRTHSADSMGPAVIQTPLAAEAEELASK